jgi:hypothetical protein
VARRHEAAGSAPRGAEVERCKPENAVEHAGIKWNVRARAIRAPPFVA